MKKTIAQLYHDAHAALGARQQAKCGNPVTQAPAHVPRVIEQAVQKAVLTTPQARRLATKLGRLSYGEWGLTSGRVDSAIDRIVGFGKLEWHARESLTDQIAA